MLIFIWCGSGSQFLFDADADPGFQMMWIRIPIRIILLFFLSLFLLSACVRSLFLLALLFTYVKMTFICWLAMLSLRCAEYLPHSVKISLIYLFFLFIFRGSHPVQVWESVSAAAGRHPSLLQGELRHQPGPYQVNRMEKHLQELWLKLLRTAFVRWLRIRDLEFTNLL